MTLASIGNLNILGSYLSFMPCRIYWNNPVFFASHGVLPLLPSLINKMTHKWRRGNCHLPRNPPERHHFTDESPFPLHLFIGFSHTSAGWMIAEVKGHGFNGSLSLPYFTEMCAQAKKKEERQTEGRLRSEFWMRRYNGVDSITRSNVAPSPVLIKSVKELFFMLSCLSLLIIYQLTK